MNLRWHQCLLGLVFMAVGSGPLSAQQESPLPEYIRLLGKPSSGSAPVVIWASGGSGFFHPRAPWHFVERSEHILSSGYAIAFVDYLAAAGRTDATGGVMSITEVARYLAQAVEALRAIPQLDSDRFVLLRSSFEVHGSWFTA